MIDLETEMKKFGRSTQINIHNTRSLIRTYPSSMSQISCRRKKPSRRKNIRVHTIELKSKMQKFTRKLRLIDFFQSENLDSSEKTRESVPEPLVKNKSNSTHLVTETSFLTLPPIL